VVTALLLWQGWMTLQFFGSSEALGRLLDQRPVVSGRHPLHLYHGYLGAQAILQSGKVSCYDPAFLAGYPKTPVFDGGSRPAELFLVLAGGGFSPAAYKLGLALCCLSAPLFFLWGARGLGLSTGAACLAAALGLLVFWSAPGERLLEAGQLDLLLAALAALLHLAMLVGFDRSPGPGHLAGLFLANGLGWFAQPLFFATLIPLNLVYYLTVGPRHRWLIWHLALGAALAGGVAVNLFWLPDWVAYWWIRSPLPVGLPDLSRRSLSSMWAAPEWGDSFDRYLGAALLLVGALGLGLWNGRRQRAAARLLGLGMIGYLTLAVAGLTWEPLGRHDAFRLLVPALFLSVLPAAAAAGRLIGGLGRRLSWTPGPRTRRAGVLSAGLLLLGGLVLHRFTTPLTPLAIGLHPQQEAIVRFLTERTSDDARILWEERPDAPAGEGWTALLPLLTKRSFLGGLDPRAGLDYAYAALAEQKLAGRPLVDWSDDELADFCRRYNVGWIACRTPATAARFRRWPHALPVGGPEPFTLFALDRPRSYVLKGQARWVAADADRITLADVVPEDGKVVLSLHHLSGLRVSPGRVQLEREPDPFDPVPFIRLHLPGPVSRITLQWDGR
jgi:hypothetical protein